MNELILISACLVGVSTRWDGGSKKNEKLIELVKSGRAIFVCPEQLGGFQTPRDPAEVEYGKTANEVLNGSAKVVNKSGADVTVGFIEGANRTLKICKELGIRKAILYKNSPSCGSRHVYDGTFTGTVIRGSGITAELLTRNGIEVFDEENFEL